MSAQSAIIQLLQSDELFSLFNKLYLPIAFADDCKKIFWTNNKFESYFSGFQLNTAINELFNISEDKISNYRPTKINFKNNIVEIQPLQREKNLSGYVILVNVLPDNIGDIISHYNIIKSIAHDFNNMFSSILSSLELLKQKLPEDKKYSYLIDNIENNSFRAAEIIEDLLAKDPKAAGRKRKIQISTLIHEAVNSIKQTIPKSIKLSLQIPGNLRQVNGKYSELYRVIMNLCINAAEAISGEGEILISAKNLNIVSGKKEGYDSLNEGHYITIKVKDTGAGIPSENIQKIFEQGFSTKEKGTDSGLGLNIIKEIILDHCGTISVESTPGAGTEFTIILPAIIKKEKQAGLRNKTILIAEDEETLKILLAELLEQKKSIDLLILDYKMPDLNGIECIKKLKAKKIDVPIILSSGSTTAANPDEIKDLNVDRVLIKPYDFDKLLDIIQDLLS